LVVNIVIFKAVVITEGRQISGNIK
jgi:hypothetical protein